MTKLLERAFAEASRMPDSEQDALARLILNEMASEERWQAAFARSQDVLARLADEALVEFERGETEPLREDTL